MNRPIYDQPSAPADEDDQRDHCELADHEAQLEHAATEIAQLHRALGEAEAEREEIRSVLEYLATAVKAQMNKPNSERRWRVLFAPMVAAARALEPHPPADAHACEGPIDCLECGGSGVEGGR